MPKPWERSVRPSRRENVLSLRTRVLVVCEGAKTEPNYFSDFPCADVIDLQIIGSGKNTDTLVEEAVIRRNQAVDRGNPFNEVWCVFDRDSFTAHHFNRALQIARNEKIRTAITNEAFELWYLLHFNFHDAGISRATYQHRLTDAMKVPYRKNIVGIYHLLIDRQPIAIRNAKKLLTRYPDWNPEVHNPSTNVFELVERLNAIAE